VSISRCRFFSISLIFNECFSSSITDSRFVDCYPKSISLRNWQNIVFVRNSSFNSFRICFEIETFTKIDISKSIIFSQLSVGFTISKRSEVHLSNVSLLGLFCHNLTSELKNHLEIEFCTFSHSAVFYNNFVFNLHHCRFYSSSPIEFGEFSDVAT
jgi:hypothetical protein